MEYKDIYSKYPLLATRLVRTSSKLNEISLIGNCNLDLSIKETKNIVNIKPFSMKAMFDIYNVGEGDGPGLFLSVSCFIKMPSENDVYNRWIYDSGSSITKEHGYYHILTIYDGGGSHITQNELNFDIEFMDSINMKIFDVKSLYLLYNQRKSCLKIPDYAKIKTLEIFNMIVDKFNSYDTIIMLNLYLMINCIILDLDISDKFLTSQKEFASLGENDYNYDDYIEETYEREDLIKDIINAIEKF